MKDKYCVLVVDDDPDIRETAALVLGLRGHAVASVSDGTEALKCLQEGPLPRLILLDLMMPGMNGFELCSRLVADPCFAGIPVVVMTGAGVLADRRTSDLKAEVLRKPVDLHTLLETVHRFCSDCDCVA